MTILRVEICFEIYDTISPSTERAPNLPMHILIVEDNINAARYIAKGLTENYFSTEIAADGEDGLFLATQNNYDLIILDVMLPKINGWTLIEKIRIMHPNIPVLFLTACDSVDERVKGFELGADDYLIKPFAFAELLMRVRSLLKRKENFSAQILQVADLRIDILKHKATRSGKALHLSRKEFMLLLLLVQKTGEVLSRTFIAEHVWDINFDSDTNVIDVAIKRLRDKVDTCPQNPLIHNIRGVGYVLEAR